MILPEQDVIHRFRRILSQVLAVLAQNLITINVSLLLTVPIIIIPVLVGIKNEPNRDEFLTITASQSSWLGSITFLVTPIGSILSGPLSDFIGRKRTMILVNVPFGMAWLLLYKASSVPSLFIGFIMLGVTRGLVEAPSYNFSAEITEPSLRSILIGLSGFIMAGGASVVFILNTFLPWREITLISLFLPVISFFVLLLIPETPQWLLSKNRTEDAEKSLRWLRGWVSSDEVNDEFVQLKRHSIKHEPQCSHSRSSFREKLSDLRQNSKPIAIIAPLFCLIYFTGVYTIRPFIVQILKAYETPIQEDEMAIWLSLVENVAPFVLLFSIRITGKRRFYFTLCGGIFLCTLVMSIYGFIILPKGYNSFDHTTNSFHLENKNLALIPLICLLILNFLAGCGIGTIPFLMLSEIIPFKSRGTVSGFIASSNYIFGFIAKKTYYNLETTLSLPGVSLFYCIVTATGLILLYFIMPETEGRTLEDIELHFSDKSKRITDWKIEKYEKTKIGLEEVRGNSKKNTNMKTANNV